MMLFSLNRDKSDLAAQSSAPLTKRSRLGRFHQKATDLAHWLPRHISWRPRGRESPIPRPTEPLPDNSSDTSTFDPRSPIVPAPKLVLHEDASSCTAPDSLQSSSETQVEPSLQAGQPTEPVELASADADADAIPDANPPLQPPPAPRRTTVELAPSSAASSSVPLIPDSTNVAPNSSGPGVASRFSPVISETQATWLGLRSGPKVADNLRKSVLRREHEASVAAAERDLALAFEENVHETPTLSGSALQTASVHNSGAEHHVKPLLYSIEKDFKAVRISRLIRYKVEDHDYFVHHVSLSTFDAAGRAEGPAITLMFDGVVHHSSSRIKASVYAARAVTHAPALAGFPQLVAVKMLAKTALWDAGMENCYEAVVWDAQATRKLSERGAQFNAGALATFQDQDYFYTVTRLYHGSLLDVVCAAAMKRADEGRRSARPYIMNPETFAFYAGELLLAMEELRDARIFHGAITPAHVLVDVDGHLALAHFGAAHADVQPGMDVQKCEYEDVLISGRAGAPMYTAPEVDGDESDVAVVTPRTDIWSLGAVLLEFALQRETPFFASLAAGNRRNRTCLRAILKADWSLERAGADSRDRRPRLHDTVHSFLSSLLQVDPKMRPTIAEAKQHPLFKNMDWESLRAKKLPPPLGVGICGELRMYIRPEFPALYPSAANPVLRRLQCQRMLNFPEFGVDWIAPRSAWPPTYCRSDIRYLASAIPSA